MLFQSRCCDVNVVLEVFFFSFCLTGALVVQDRKAVEKRKEQDKAKEKQQEELSKQRQIEKVILSLKAPVCDIFALIGQLQNYFDGTLCCNKANGISAV